MKTFLIVLTWLLTAVQSFAFQVEKNTKSNWVNDINFTSDSILDDVGGYQYLLIDNQVNLIEEEIYSHIEYKILNVEGIQSMSNISINYDPTYQKLILNSIKLTRGGNTIDKLQQSDIQVFQKEQNSDKFLYDGSLTANINLSDVRINDIINYSYSIKGFNPVNKGHFVRSYYHEYSFPVNTFYTRLVFPKNKLLHYKLYNGLKEPISKESGQQKEFIWQSDGINFNIYENDVPSWYENQKYIAISSFNNWKEVVDWGLPLYNFSENNLSSINKAITNSKIKEERIIELVRFVQDEVRYLGLEDGINAFKPHSPKQVFEQRFGDCKDKSFLLAALLRSEGFESYPLLVNTYLEGHIKEELPSHLVFNHCIVNLKVENKNYYIDPTISNQGGTIRNMDTPDYKYGLLLKKGQEELINFRKLVIPTIDIVETIINDSIEGPTHLDITTKYTGSKADQIRTYFENNSKASIEKSYQEFYSSLYPGIETNNRIQLIDTNRTTSNIVEVIESYKINDFWYIADEKKKHLIYSDIYPLVLNSSISIPNSSERKMPFSLSKPFNFKQTTNLKLPEDWPVENENIEISGLGFKYKNIIKGDNNNISVVHEYSLFKDHILPSEIKNYQDKHQQIENELNYQLYFNKNINNQSISFTPYLITILSLILSMFLVWHLYYNFNPNVNEFNRNYQIGGWLIIPLIGLVTYPIAYIAQLASADFYLASLWNVSEMELDLDPIKFKLLLAFELIYNISMLIFSTFLLILFIKRRSSLPFLISVLYLLNFIGLSGDSYLSDQILPESLKEESSNMKEIIRSVVSIIIWVPYFNFSKRSKNTFVKTLNTNKNQKLNSTSEEIRD